MTPQLSQAHIAAVNRNRRIVLNFDVTYPINISFDAHGSVDAFVAHLFTFADDAGSQIDSIWWNWGEGNQAPYPSEFLPLYDHPLYRQWVEVGVDIVQIVLEATRQRGLEAFFSHRMNGSDNDLGPFARIPMKVQHPDWMFRTPWCTHEDNGYWNFALEEVHEYVLRNLREVAERYDFDGIELDFARGVVFPAGQGWLNRDKLTQFIRELRLMLLEIERRRERPFLLAARVPENLVGCHFDALDVETWARQQLVDIFTLGVRSFDVDIVAFRQITVGTPIKLYPSIDDHHASDGYQNPGIEVFRGMAANWWHQGADGIQTFNFNYAPDAPYKGQDWQSHQLAYHEIGSPETLQGKHKVFVVQRRGGGHGPRVIPNPEDWSTPRHSYANSNMLAPLPAKLANNDKVDTLLTVVVADDVAAEADRVERIAIRLLLSDPEAEDLPADQRLQVVTVATIGHPGNLQNIPAAKGIEAQIEVRLNNVPLGRPTVDGGWLVFEAAPNLFAVGENLVGVRATQPPAGAQHEIWIEKLEVHVAYQRR
ncbi:MAG: family 10 glycosylhydrolase [Candidatus Poribacteria bacterium]|nr:family 10 glycosylhydrolase [Candidatus Poribacteria bacterium]